MAKRSRMWAPCRVPVVTLFLGLLGLGGFSSGARAAPASEGPEGWPEERARGVALEDLDRIGAPTELGSPLAAFVRAELGRGPTATRISVMSLAFVSASADEVVVDVVGRAARFVDADPTQRGHGLGWVRLAVPRVADAGVCEFGALRVVSERSLVDMHPRIAVSLAGETAVLEDRALGFRRVFPIGIGAVDRIRAKGRVASLTPSTEWGRVDKKNAYRALGSWFRGRPYIPLEVPFVWHTKDGKGHRAYAVTRVAFHAWQGKNLLRGFISHGCMTLRDGDLDELAAFVQGSEGPLPTAIRAAERPDVWHPYPRTEDRYYALENFGSATAPTFRVAGNLYVTERVVGTPPTGELVDIYMDPEARARAELVVAGRPHALMMP